MNDDVKPLDKEVEKPWRRYFKKAGSIALQLIVLMALIWLLDFWMTRNTVHETPPPIHQMTLSGEEFSLDNLKGEPSIIHFWGTWCPICNIEQGTIESMGKSYPMMTIAMRSGSDAEIADYLIEKGVSYRVINDNSGAISNRYGVSAVPTTFILDREGVIRFVTQGYSSELGLRFKLWLASL